MATFSPDDTFRILGKACARVGLDASDAHLLRLGENAIYGLPSAGVVVRIARSMAVLDDVRKEVGVVRWLKEAEYPAARLAAVDDVEQPIVVDGHPVTLWRFIETVEPRPGAADLGALLRRLHDLDVPSWLHLPPFRPFGRVAERLAAAPPSAPATDVEFLRRRFDELHGEYERIAFVFPPGPVHGDAHPGNLMRTAMGEVVLIDFEQFCFGPREWDLSLAAVYRYAFEWFTEEEYSGFVEAYRYDIVGWPGLNVLRALRELGMITWLMQMVEHDETKAAEFRRRVNDMRSGRFPRRWKLF